MCQDYKMTLILVHVSRALSLSWCTNLVIAVFSHQVTDKDLVGGFRVEDLEPKLKRISDFGGVDVAAAAFRDLHDDVRRVHVALLEQRRLDLALDGLWR